MLLSHSITHLGSIHVVMFISSSFFVLLRSSLLCGGPWFVYPWPSWKTLFSFWWIYVKSLKTFTFRFRWIFSFLVSFFFSTYLGRIPGLYGMYKFNFIKKNYQTNHFPKQLTTVFHFSERCVRVELLYPLLSLDKENFHYYF